MSQGFTEFLVDPTGRAPKNLADSIRRVSNASVAFVHSWVGGELNDAQATSQEAYEHLDFIQGELLRHRDVQRRQTATWQASPLKAVLGATVGRLAADVSHNEELWFRSLENGSGSLPTGPSLSALTLEMALVKLKHRDTVAVNFSATLPYQHRLYALISSGMGQPATLVEIDVPLLCAASKAAAALV